MTGIIAVNSYAELKGMAYQSQRMKEELSLLGIQTKILRTAEMNYGIKNSRAEFLENCGFVIFFDKDKYLPRIIEKCGIRLFNNASSIELCDDKMLTHIALADRGIPMPDVISSPLCYTQGKNPDENFLLGVSKKLGFPVILKKSFGSLGKDVRLIYNYNDMISAEKEYMYSPHIYQRYIGAHSGEDIRIIIIGGKAVSSMARKNKEDFRSNIEAGGKGEKCVPPEEFISVAEKEAKILKLDYCGVDLLIDENGAPLLCEVNSNAFFTAMEECTGFNVAGAYAKYIYEVLK